ncbi:MAG TPA: response regulator [Terriglobales bacterium]|nr:response regulator [Terriglobales bacterium]
MPQDTPPKILIADNDEQVLLSLERTLEDEGYATTLTLSGGEAIRTLSYDTYDLLVLDDCLSDFHCLQVLARCQAAGTRPPVVVTYNRFPSLAERSQLRSLGVNILVNKRDQHELLLTVRYMLERLPASRQIHDST